MKTSPLSPIKSLLTEAWHSVHGAKTDIWIAAGITLLVGFVAGFIAGLVTPLSQQLAAFVNWIGQILTTLLQMGILYIGIMRAKGMPIDYKQVLRPFEKSILWKVIGLYLIEFFIFLVLFVIFGFLPTVFLNGQVNTVLHSGLNLANLLLIAWFIIGFFVTLFIALRLFLAFAFTLDQGTRPIEAIKRSIRATNHSEWPLFVLVCCHFLALFVGMLLALIGLIWAVPFALILYGTVYKKLMQNA
jgi:hypothetical protein